MTGFNESMGLGYKYWAERNVYEVESDENLYDQIIELRQEVRMRVINVIKEAVRPLIKYIEEQAHLVLALALDPRYCTMAILRKVYLAYIQIEPGQVDFSEDDEKSRRQQEARDLVQEYDDLMLKLAMDVHENNTTKENGSAQISADPEEDFMSDDDDDDFLNNGTIDDSDAAFHQMVSCELQRFRTRNTQRV